ncbi:MAG: hypothetical protein OEN55_02485 [Alphaproteobacteria bacterium]|nr:hypothetical protein [Alphaproteobacteria bacterium]
MREAKRTLPELTAADHAVIAGNLRAATGGAAPHHAWRLMAELADATGPGGAAGEGEEAGEARVVAAIEAAMALSPRDPLEAMLVSQMAAVHAATMRCLRRAAECTEHPRIEALYLRTATRLMNLFVRQTEALDRRARQLGRAGEKAADPFGAAPAADGPDAEPDPDGAEILARLVEAYWADIRANMAARQDAEGGGEAQGAFGEGGPDPDPGGGPGP